MWNPHKFRKVHVTLVISQKDLAFSHQILAMCHQNLVFSHEHVVFSHEARTFSHQIGWFPISRWSPGLIGCDPPAMLPRLRLRAAHLGGVAIGDADLLDETRLGSRSQAECSEKWHENSWKLMRIDEIGWKLMRIDDVHRCLFYDFLIKLKRWIMMNGDENIYVRVS